MLGPVSTWIGDRPNDNYAGYFKKVNPHLVAWGVVGEDTKWSHSACLRKISQNASRKTTNVMLGLTRIFELCPNPTGVFVYHGPRDGDAAQPGLPPLSLL
jgi:hypothetical protein